MHVRPSDEADSSVLASPSLVEFPVYRCAGVSPPPSTTSGTTRLALSGLSELPEPTPVFNGQTNKRR